MHRLNAFMRCALVTAAIAIPSASLAQVLITIAPPPLVVYEQPPLPGPGYIWTPGYWAYGPDGYFWVPGTWVEPPSVGVLWTPGYWGWRNGSYLWNAGYWGPTIGYYGGINYGYGYVGTGYHGGYWNGGVFAYNKTVNNFGGVHITNVYSKTVINTTTVKNVSFNGGPGGTTLKPTAQQLTYAQQNHVQATSAQTLQQTTASTNKDLLHSVNNGKPAVAATSSAGQFTGTGVTGVKNVTGVGNTSPAGTGPKGVTGTGTNTLSTTNTNTLSKTTNTNTNTNTLSKGTNVNTNTLSNKGNVNINANTLPKGNTSNVNTLSNKGNVNINANTTPKINTTPKVNAISQTNVGAAGAGGAPKNFKASGPPPQPKKPVPKQ
jgi:hypothetical protein